MSELAFLIDLLLNHRLPKATKDAIAARIKEVECKSSSLPSPAYARPLPSPVALPPHIASQPASTQAAMLKQLAQDGTPITVEPQPVAPEPPPVAVIAQTPQAAAALAARNASISQARSGKPLPGETSPRKW